MARTSATAWITRSPLAWPYPSLTALNRSTSTIAAVNGRPPSRAAATAGPSTMSRWRRLCNPVRPSRRAWSASSARSRSRSVASRTTTTDAGVSPPVPTSVTRMSRTRPVVVVTRRPARAAASDSRGSRSSHSRPRSRTSGVPWAARSGASSSWAAGLAWTTRPRSSTTTTPSATAEMTCCNEMGRLAVASPRPPVHSQIPAVTTDIAPVRSTAPKVEAPLTDTTAPTAGRTRASMATA